MLDFNDAPAELPADLDVTRESIRADLVARLESVLATLFPAGKKRKGKFLIGDVLGSPGDSLEVVLDGEKAGLWTDRATGDGGDIFDLIAAARGIDARDLSGLRLAADDGKFVDGQAEEPGIRQNGSDVAEKDSWLGKIGNVPDGGSDLC